MEIEPKTGPKISMVHTNYNHAQYLEESFVGVIAQTYSNRKLIVVDDGSTDNSWKVLERIARSGALAATSFGSARRRRRRPPSSMASEGRPDAVAHALSVRSRGC
jgi:glycosyltransferase involved in cell wall biosynthesis